MFVNYVGDSLRERYGHKLYKLALDGGMTCPNRDGTLGTEGCIFCLDGSGAFAERRAASVSEQVERAKLRVSAKAGKDCGYIAYFQSYTNTYAPAGYLERLFGETIACEGVEILSVATRPDCLPPETISLLSRLNKIKPVWVELGLQTSNERTAELIRRGYLTPVYDDAVRRLRAEGIETVTHIIFGLPGETRADMLSTVRHVAGLCRETENISATAAPMGVKLQLLHILRGTALYDMYAAGQVRPMERDEYISTVCEALTLLPREMIVHRLTGDGDKCSLAAPLWSGDKKAVRAAMDRALRERDIVQGSGEGFQIC